MLICVSSYTNTETNIDSMSYSKLGYQDLFLDELFLFCNWFFINPCLFNVCQPFVSHLFHNENPCLVLIQINTNLYLVKCPDINWCSNFYDNPSHHQLQGKLRNCECCFWRKCEFNFKVSHCYCFLKQVFYCQTCILL